MGQAIEFNKDIHMVYVVDDDEAMRAAACELMIDIGYMAKGYSDATSFLNGVPDPRGVLLLDLRLKGISGLGLQQRVAHCKTLAIVFMSGVAEIPDTVAAMKAGASDFLIKPVRAQILIDAVSNAMEKLREARAATGRSLASRLKYSLLTETEREIAGLIAAGLRNREIAEATGRAENTVKVHRARIMQKMATGSGYELMLELHALGIDPSPCDSDP